MEKVISEIKQVILLLTEIKDFQSKSYLEQKSMWTVEELSGYTGFTVESIYQLTSRGKIPHYKPNGKRIFFAKEEIIVWLKRNPVREEEAVVIDLLNSKSKRV